MFVGTFVPEKNSFSHFSAIKFRKHHRVIQIHKVQSVMISEGYLIQRKGEI